MSWKGAVALVAILTIGAGLRIHWGPQLHDSGVGGDALQYFKLAVHLEREHSFSFDGKTPTWTRLPGQPLLLGAATRPSPAQTRVGTEEEQRAGVYAFLASCRTLGIAIELTTALLIALLALLLGAGHFALLGALLWAIQPWTSIVALRPLADAPATLLTTLCLILLLRAQSPWGFAIAGATAGLAQLFRPDSILLVPTIALGAFLVRHRWRAMLAGGALWVLVFSPWPIRNLLRFGHPHPFAGGTNIALQGQEFDRSSVMDWMRTWAASEKATVEIAWRIQGRPLPLAELPPEAIDGPAERAELERLLGAYAKAGHRVTDEVAQGFRTLAAERRARHPFTHWVGLPLRRVARVLFPPWDGYGLGTLPTLIAQRTFWCILGAAVVIAGLFGLTLLLWRRATRPMAAVLALALLARCALLAWMPTIEARYGLEILPLLFATAVAGARRIVNGADVVRSQQSACTKSKRLFFAPLEDKQVKFPKATPYSGAHSD